MIFSFLDSFFPSYRQHIEHKLKSRYTIADLVRQQLAGITVDLSYLDEMSEEEREEFLVKGKQIHENPAFQRVATHRISEQVDLTVKDAKNIEEVNFGRATINGISLLQEEFERLAGMYDEKHKPAEAFNKFETL